MARIHTKFSWYMRTPRKEYEFKFYCSIFELFIARIYHSLTIKYFVCLPVCLYLFVCRNINIWCSGVKLGTFLHRYQWKEFENNLIYKATYGRGSISQIL